jgi:Protein of unknown function (DUF3052)
MSGYSGTPLGKKLGLKDGMRVVFLDMPDSVAETITDYDAVLIDAGNDPPDVVMLFQTDRFVLDNRLQEYRNSIAQNGMIWVAWPKKASRVPTDITEDVIREICLPLGLVDVKVCAIDERWSGLKLVIRKELRT